jgi:hypothetical protein
MSCFTAFLLAFQVIISWLDPAGKYNFLTNKSIPVFHKGQIPCSYLSDPKFHLEDQQQVVFVRSQVKV